MSKLVVTADDFKFPKCCGLQVIGNFVTEDPAILLDGDTILASVLLSWKGAWVATTIRSQTHACAALAAAGFEALREFRNPNTGAYVTLWLKAEPQRKRTTRKKKEAK